MTLRPGVHTVPTADRDGITALMRAINDAFADMGPVLPLGPGRKQPAALENWSPFGPQGWLAALPPNAAALVATSGSSGEPKLVVLSAAALQASAHATHAQLSGPGQWLLALPAHHIAGLQVVVRSVLAETKPAVLPPGPFTAAAFCAASRPLIRGELPAYVSLVPTQLGQLLADDDACQILARFAAVLVGGAALAEPIAEQARERGINVITTYGMSETAGGCVYNGVPLEQTQWQLAANGRISLAGPMLAEGYLGRPDLTAQSFGVQGDTRWFHTLDRGEEVEGKLRVLGRIDEVIISGGLNIAPTEVENALLTHPKVSNAVVVGVPDSHWGQRVVALITVRNHAATPEAISAPGELQELVKKRVGSAAVPKEIFVTSHLPTLESGKIDRQGALELASSLSTPSS